MRRADPDEGQDDRHLEGDQGRVDPRRAAVARDQQRGEGQHDARRGQVHDSALPRRGGERRRQVQAGIRHQALGVARPADRDGGGGQREFEHEVPADDPGRQRPEDRPGVGIARPCHRHHRGQFRVAEAHEPAGDAAQHEGQHQAGPGIMGRRRPGQHEDPGAHGRTDADADEAEGGEVAGEVRLVGPRRGEIGDAPGRGGGGVGHTVRLFRLDVPPHQANSAAGRIGHGRNAGRLWRFLRFRVWSAPPRPG
jgi:hypothetical protein